jgi:hypothetical protein
MLHRILGIVVLSTLAVEGFGQSESLSQGPYRIEIQLERGDGDVWRAIDARSILDQNDRVRFVVKTNFGGYLYVTNQSTSGRYEVLFPGKETGRQNKIEAGKSYVVPANEGWFRIAGPPGHEVIYWLVSPIELAGTETARPPAPDPGPARKPPTLLPRCDDGIMRARGDCVDISAGPGEVADRNTLPADLARVPNFKSRDLTFIRQENSSIVSSAVPLNGPVIYQFRLAHR